MPQSTVSRHLRVLLFAVLFLTIDELYSHFYFVFIPVLSMLPWVVLAPLMYKWMRRRSQQALHLLLENMAMLAH